MSHRAQARIEDEQLKHWADRASSQAALRCIYVACQKALHARASSRSRIAIEAIIRRGRGFPCESQSQIDRRITDFSLYYYALCSIFQEIDLDQEVVMGMWIASRSIVTRRSWHRRWQDASVLAGSFHTRHKVVVFALLALNGHNRSTNGPRWQMTDIPLFARTP